MSPAYLASQRTSPGFPVCAGVSLIYTLTGGPGGNFPRVCGDVCGDEPDRHAYMLDFWSNCCTFAPYPISVYAREGNISADVGCSL